MCVCVWKGGGGEGQNLKCQNIHLKATCANVLESLDSILESNWSQGDEVIDFIREVKVVAGRICIS